MTIAIVCGSRNWNKPKPIYDALVKLPEDSVIIHGAQRGADSVADSVAKELGFDTIPVEADWDAYENGAAGPIRNEEMLNMLISSCKAYSQPANCFAFHEDTKLGRGTRDMTIRCIKSKIRTYVWVPVSDSPRAGHLCICKICKRDYISHPQIISELDSNRDPFLNWICDGQVLKL